MLPFQNKTFLESDFFRATLIRSSHVQVMWGQILIKWFVLLFVHLKSAKVPTNLPTSSVDDDNGDKSIINNDNQFNGRSNNNNQLSSHLHNLSISTNFLVFYSGSSCPSRPYNFGSLRIILSIKSSKQNWLIIIKHDILD